MKMLRFLLEKEFHQIRRNPAILRMMFIMPIIQLIVLPFAANYEVKDVKLVIVDNDHSSLSRESIQTITASGYFQLIKMASSYHEALGWIESDEADLILEFPNKAEEMLIREDQISIYLAVNAINGMKANIGASYLQQILSKINANVREQWITLPRYLPEPIIEVKKSFWYNRFMDYKLFMVPGILTLLLTMIGSFLASLNIVREKEIGTIEQINVTPIPKGIFIAGKLIPFWLMSQIVLGLGLLVARVIYGIESWPVLAWIYLFNAIYMLAILGLGLYISTITANQQQAVLVSFFFMMVFILMSGLYTSIDAMPYWAKLVTMFNPVSYYVELMRMLIIKRSGLHDILPFLWIMILFAIFTLSIAVLNYKKRV